MEESSPSITGSRTRTVCYIHSYPAAADIISILWDGYQKLGLPIIGVDCEDKPTSWPQPIETIKAGVDIHWMENRKNLPKRLVQTLRHFLSTDYQRCVVMEYDTLILGPLPDWPLHPCRMIAKASGGPADGSEASQFFHTPWVFDRSSAGVVIGVGQKLIDDGTVERGVHGSPDVFLGLIVDAVNMRWEDSGTFSVNSLDLPENVIAAQEAHRNGCVFFHGVKDDLQKRAVTAQNSG